MSRLRQTLESAHATAASAVGALSSMLAVKRPASRAALTACVRQLREAADRIEREFLK